MPSEQTDELEYIFDPVIRATDKFGVNTPELDKAMDEARAAILKRVEEARIDELQYLEHAREEAIGPDKFISEYITKRVKQLAAGEEKHE
jgi:hypothetical protein